MALQQGEPGPEVGGDLAARLGALERRVAALEGAASGRPAWNGEPKGEDDRFWVLHGLKDRFGDRSVLVFAGSVGLAADARFEWQQYADAAALLESDWGELAESLAALGQPARLMLLNAVLEGAATSAQLQQTEGFGTSGQLYHHLHQLTSAGWLRSSGRGRYEVPPARVVPLLVVLAACHR